MAYLVATPLVIVPVVWLVYRYLATPEQIDLVVASFASLGHHLPGFMRCYGDRELFERFKWRFLFMPPLFVATSMFFTWNGLHGLMMVIVFWGGWHGLMQLYGFMRIYDMKRGWHDGLTATLDFWLCFAIFLAGTVFSEARMYGMMAALWNSGVPLLEPIWLVVFRYLTVAVVALVMLAYVVNLVRTNRMGVGVSWVKLLLALTTGVFYWVCGLVTTNLVVGIAMFEIFHALQYYAIVWTYNRKLAERTSGRFGPLGFMFQDRWFFLGLYLAAIFAFGSFRFFGAAAESQTLQNVVVAMISASSLLHYYYDGFIWKFRDNKTRANLEITGEGAKANRWGTPAAHVVKVGLLMLLLAGSVVLERRNGKVTPQEQDELLQAMAAWTPTLPEVQSQISSLELERKNPQRALEIAREVVRLRPRWYSSYTELAAALIATGQYVEAGTAAYESIQLNPRSWNGYYMLGIAKERQARLAQAETYYRQALAILPNNPPVLHALASVLARNGQPEEAITYFELLTRNQQASLQIRNDYCAALTAAGRHREALDIAIETVEENSASAVAYERLGTVYLARGELAEAVKPLRKATQLDPDASEAFYKLGRVFRGLGKPWAAAEWFQQAIEIDPSDAPAHFQLAMMLYSMQEWDTAERHLQECLKLSPDFPDPFAKTGDAMANIATVMFELGMFQAAERCYRKAIEKSPNSATIYYNFGLLMLEQGDETQARQLVLKANELGMQSPRELNELLGI